MAITHYKELIVWQRSIDLVDRIYFIAGQLPKPEFFGLVSQMQRAAVAVPSNIAEGHARNHTAEFVQFLGIAYASTAELETQLIIAQRQYPSIKCEEAFRLITEVQKMLSVLIKKLKLRSGN